MEIMFPIQQLLLFVLSLILINRVTKTTASTQSVLPNDKDVMTYGNMKSFMPGNYGSLLMDRRDPSPAPDCFNSYILKSYSINKNYSQNYEACIRSALESRQSIENRMLSGKLSINDASEGICQRYKTCNNLNDTLAVFACHSKIGSETSKEVYLISANATDNEALLREEYRLINRHHQQCGKLAERSYIQATAENYRELQNCLEGDKDSRPSIPGMGPSEQENTDTAEEETTQDELSSLNVTGGSYRIFEETPNDTKTLELKAAPTQSASQRLSKLLNKLLN